MADACIYLMETYEGNDFFNIGTGKEITIKGLAELIKEVVGYEGKIVWDSTKPDGTPRKLLDVSRISRLILFSKKCFSYLCFVAPSPCGLQVCYYAKYENHFL